MSIRPHPGPFLLLLLIACGDGDSSGTDTVNNAGGAAGSGGGGPGGVAGASGTSAGTSGGSGQGGTTAGSAGSSGQAGGPGGSAGSAGAAPNFLKAGSYNLDALFTSGLPCGGSPENGGKPLPARLDLAQTAQGEWFAAVSFSGQAAGLFTTKASSDTSLTLAGSTTELNLLDDSSYYASTWQRFTLTASEATPTGMAVHGEALTSTSDGTVETCSLIDVTLDGTLVADTTAPTGRFEQVPRFARHRQVLLPWDPITLTFSELIRPAALEGALTVTSTVGGVSTTQPVTWEPDPASLGSPPVLALAGTRFLTTKMKAPDKGGTWADGATLSFAVSGAVTDPAGNALAVPPKTLQVVDPGPPQPSLAFDDKAPPGLWGAAKYLPAGSADCETGGCIELPASNDVCPGSLAGLTVRLSMLEGASQLHVRYRLDTGDVFYAGSATLEFTYHNSLFPPQSLADGLTEDDMLPLVPPAPPLTRRSPWQTRTLSVAPSEPGAVAVSVSKGNGSGTPCVDDEDAPVTRVVIDRMWVD